MSWPIVKLESIFKIARGGSPRPISEYITDDPDGLNWISIKDASNSEKYITKTKQKIKREGLAKSRLVRPGDFLLTNSMSFGRPYIMKTTGCIHDGWLVLSSKKDEVDQDYFYHFLSSNLVYRKFSRLAAGAVVKNLNIDLVKGVEIPLPPLAEQQKIAAILDAADQLRQKDQQLIDHYTALSQSLFLEMFGDPVSNPKGWECINLEAIANIASGVTKGRKLKSTDIIEIPYMRVANVQAGHLNLDEIKTLPGTNDDIEKYGLLKGDVLLTEGGDPDKLGRGTVWNGEVENCIHQNHIFRVRLISKSFEPIYLSWLCGSEYGKRYFLKSGKQTTGIASINKTQLKRFPVLIPPVELQNQFSDKLKVIEKQKQQAQTNLQNSESLFNSLLQRAFKGELTSSEAA